MKGEAEIRFGEYVHVDEYGNVDLEKWFEAIKDNPYIKELT